MTRLPLLEAIRVQCEGLQRLTNALGVPDKFHATITVAWVLLVHDRVAAAGAKTSWSAFCDANPDLFAKGGAVLGRTKAPPSCVPLTPGTPSYLRTER